MPDLDGRKLFRPRDFPEVHPREFKRQMDKAHAEQILSMRGLIDRMVAEYSWAYGAFSDLTRSDQAKVRTAAADPTQAIVVNRDRFRRELEKAAHLAVKAFNDCSNTLDARTRSLEKTMGRLSPNHSSTYRQLGPDRGSKLPRTDRERLAEYQTARMARGEHFGG